MRDPGQDVLNDHCSDPLSQKLLLPNHEYECNIIFISTMFEMLHVTAHWELGNPYAQRIV